MSCTSRSSFVGNPADSESPVALRIPLARGLPFRFECSVQINPRAASCDLSSEKVEAVEKTASALRVHMYASRNSCCGSVGGWRDSLFSQKTFGPDLIVS